jgi:hypothetical protein
MQSEILAASASEIASMSGAAPSPTGRERADQGAAALLLAERGVAADLAASVTPTPNPTPSPTPNP